jgi:hypothetical protein
MRVLPRSPGCDRLRISPGTYPAAQQGGLDQLFNYALACVNCNLLKSQHIEHKDPETDVITRLFNPRTDEWKQHFRFSRDTLKIIGKTPIGRATERLLQLNSAKQLQARRFWVELGIYP